MRLKKQATTHHLLRRTAAAGGHLVNRCTCPWCATGTTADRLIVTLAAITPCTGCWESSGYGYRWATGGTFAGGPYNLPWVARDEVWNKCIYTLDPDYTGPVLGVYDIPAIPPPIDCLVDWTLRELRPVEFLELIIELGEDAGVAYRGIVVYANVWSEENDTYYSHIIYQFNESPGAVPLDCSENWGGASIYQVGDCLPVGTVVAYGGTADVVAVP